MAPPGPAHTLSSQEPPTPGQAMLKAKEPLQVGKSTESEAAHLWPGAPASGSGPAALSPGPLPGPPAPTVMEFPTPPAPQPPSAPGECRKGSPRHEAETLGPFSLSPCLGHPSGHTTDQAPECPRESWDRVSPAHYR